MQNVYLRLFLISKDDINCTSQMTTQNPNIHNDCSSQLNIHARRSSAPILHNFDAVPQLTHLHPSSDLQSSAIQFFAEEDDNQ